MLAKRLLLLLKLDTDDEYIKKNVLQMHPKSCFEILRSKQMLWITTQHIKNLKMVSDLSIAVDESYYISNAVQVLLFVRFISCNSCPKEELLGLLLLKSKTHGEDIASIVIESMDKHHIPLDKIVIDFNR